MRIRDWSSDVCSSDLLLALDTRAIAQSDRERDCRRAGWRAKCLVTVRRLRSSTNAGHNNQCRSPAPPWRGHCAEIRHGAGGHRGRSEEHTSELQSLMRISYAVFCLKKKKNIPINDLHSVVT